MDNFSRNVYVEEVNNTISTESKSYWDENREAALNDVVDANTEFKKVYEYSPVPVSPQESFALTSQDKTSETSINLNGAKTGPNNPLDYVLEKSKVIGPTQNSFIANNAVVPEVHVPNTSRNMANTMNFSQFNKELKFNDAIWNTSENNNLVHTKSMHTQLNGEFHINEYTNNLSSKMPVSIHKPRLIQKKSSVENFNTAMISSRKSISGHSNSSIADKMAWAVRAARDKLDSASNVSECSSNFDLESNCSEQAETMSTISDVSGYEEEMYRIRRLLLQDSPPVICEDSLSSLGKNYQKTRECHLNGNMEANEPSSENYDILLYKLRTQLQSVLEEKEKLAIKLSDVESRLSVEWHDKFQVVLREKAHLEGCLESMQAEINALHAEKQQNLFQAKGAEKEAQSKTLLETKKLFLELESLTAENAKLMKEVREINMKFQEGKLQLELLESEKIQLKDDLRETESSNETLRITLQELKVDFESKLSAIEGLKKKITDLHVECQSLMQAKLKADNMSTFFKNELDMTRNSFSWYQEQLQNCQEAKVKMQQELMAAQTNIVTCNHLMEKMKGEKALLLQAVEDTQKRAVREKESLLRKLELIQADMLEREATILMHVHKDSVATETISLVSAKLKHLEEERSKQVNTSFEEQEMKIEDLKNELISKENAVEALELENSDLMKSLTTLQKTLNEKEIYNQIIANKFKHLEMIHQQLAETMKNKDESLLNVKNEKVALEVALSAAVNEKIEVDIVTAKLREDFSQMANSFKCMQLEIQSKEKHIKDLKEEISNLQQQNKLVASSLEEKVKNEQDLIDLKSKLISLGDLEHKISDLKSLNEELQVKLSEKSESLKFYKNNMKKFEETLEFREQQLHNQTQNFEVYQNEMRVQESKILELQNEKQLALNNNNKLQALIKDLSEDKSVLNKELESLRHQMKQANIVIEQFSDLCKGTEREKNEIGRQLKLALNDLQKANNLHTQIKNDKHITIETINISESEKCVDDETIPSSCTLLQHDTRNTKSCIEQIEQDIISFIEKSGHIGVEILKKSGNKDEDMLHSLNTISSAVNNMISELNKNFTEIESLKISKAVLEDEILRLRLDLQKYSHAEAQQNSKETQTISCMTESNPTIQVDESYIKDKEIKKLKDILTLKEVEQQEKYKRYESNVRTLLKKVKEQMRGRKFAERQLEQLRGSGHSSFNLSETDALRLEIKKLEAALEISNTKLEEQRKIAEKSHICLLELEKQRGKLEKSHESTNDSSTVENVNGILPEADDLDQKAWNIKNQQMTTRIVEMEHEAKAFVSTISELRKQIFTEKCETSQLRKQIASIQLGLNNANDIIDRKNKELKQAAAEYKELQEKNKCLHNELQFEKDEHEKCILNIEKLKGELEETKTKDPLLADQIKSLSYHLHQRQQEVAALQEKMTLAEQNWASLESGYHKRLNSLQKEIEKLKKEMDVIRKDKFTLQGQTAELRAGLQSTIDQNKVLKLKLDAHSCDNNRLKLPDLTSSLPSPPVIYDDAQIAELLHHSTVLPQNKPLNNLQSCLDSLKQEMASLQRQIAEKTSGYISQEVTKVSENESTVQNI